MTQNITAMNKPVSKSIVVRKKQPASLVLDEDSVKTWIKQSNNITNMMADYNVIQMRILVIVMEAMQEAINGNINRQATAQLDLFQNDIDKYGKITIAVPMKNFGVKSNHYAELRTALETFSKISVQFKVDSPYAGKNATKYTHLMDVTIPEKYQKSVVFNIDKEIAEKFLNVQGGFTKFLKEVVFALDSPYNIKFYYMCCSWLAKGGWSMKMEDLRQWLCIGDKYKLFKDFNRRVLKPTQEALEQNANCWFEYTPIFDEGEKQPRRIDFKIFRNVMTVEEEQYFDSHVQNMRNLMFTHFQIEDGIFSKELLPLLTLYNIEKATNKLMELFVYLQDHAEEVANKKEYLIKSMINYLDPRF